MLSCYERLNKLVDYIVDNFAEEDQDLILIEEMSELTKELLHHKRNREANIAEEISHVLISLVVVMNIHGLQEEDILKQVNKKLQKYTSNEKKKKRELFSYLFSQQCNVLSFNEEE